MSSGRGEFLKWLREDRAKRLAERADRYAKQPENIRAALAKVAGVQNVRLDEMSAKDRAALLEAAKKLSTSILHAIAILIATQTE